MARAEATGRLKHIRAVLDRASAVPPGLGGLPSRRRRVWAAIVVGYAGVLAVALAVDASLTVVERAGAEAVLVLVAWALAGRLLRRPFVPGPLRRPLVAARPLYWVLIAAWIANIARVEGGLDRLTLTQYLGVASAAWFGWHGIHGRWPPSVRAMWRRVGGRLPTPRSRVRGSTTRRLRERYRTGRRRGGAVALAPNRKRRVALGVAGAAVSWLLAAGILGAFATGRFGETDIGSPVIMVSLFLLGTGFLTLRRGLGRTASETAVADSATVLYLRPFLQDGAGRDLARIRRSTEQRLARGLTPVGELVAIGNPGELLPDLGALRVYVPDERWQAEVEALMRQATACIVQCLPTPAVAWEISRLVAAFDPRRLVVFVPDPARHYPACHALLASTFPRGLPPAPEPHPARSAFAVMAFDERWEPAIGVAQSHDLVRTVVDLLHTRPPEPGRRGQVRRFSSP